MPIACHRARSWDHGQKDRQYGQGNDAAQLFYKEMLVNEILTPVYKKIKRLILFKEDLEYPRLKLKEKMYIF